MGLLRYGSRQVIHVDDWTLAHLQVAIGVKLHLKESFHLSWTNDHEGDGGRGAVWISPGVALVYTFSDGQWPFLNSKWVEALVQSANTPEGMTVLLEPRPLVVHSTSQRQGIWI
ncbi:ATP-dependent DNA ligase [Cryobacterium lactosi]|uniref:ATP-dependent DNA ligase n=1 Tax=Cryobacterium lactosi TaxID=1259202 RepID=A0A4R9BU12_9MICO|nr:ATP-dependent DNA ligase [Cryobacterium lactosi]TFD90818.1 ATP-dependent DNA ligase [Cryobacterium lactosi]